MTGLDQHAVHAWVANHDPLHVAARRLEVVGGHAVDSSYVETFWLPILGPTSLWALRRLVRIADEHPAGFDVAMVPFAQSLGVDGKGRAGRNAPIVRSVARLILFHAAEIDGDTLLVHRQLRTLNYAQLHRLPTHLVAMHDEMFGRDPSLGGVDRVPAGPRTA